MRQTDKSCKGGPNGFAFAPLPVCHLGVLGGFTIFYHSHQFSALSVLTFYHFLAPTGSTVLTILPFPNVTIWSRLLVLPFYQLRQFSALSVLTFYHFPAPYQFYHFTIFTNFPSIGSLVILASLVSLFSLFMLVIPARIPRLCALGILVGTAILAILFFLVNLGCLGLHVVIVTRPRLISLICLRLGLGAARP